MFAFSILKKWRFSSLPCIAQGVGVSEDLLFRHFGNKKSLLDALMQEAEQRLVQVFAHLLNEKDPWMVIENTLRTPFDIDKGEYDHWKLKFQLTRYAA